MMRTVREGNSSERAVPAANPIATMKATTIRHMAGRSPLLRFNPSRLDDRAPLCGIIRDELGQRLRPRLAGARALLRELRLIVRALLRGHHRALQPLNDR